tara:strand:- start:45 stop:455 length:411 start_codon:yes stop_codon:yes gene_type:complete
VLSCSSEPPSEELLNNLKQAIQEFNSMYDANGNLEGNRFKEYEVSYANGYILIEASPSKIDNSDLTPDYENLKKTIGDNVNARETMNLKIDRNRYKSYIKKIREIRWGIAKDYDLRIRMYRDGKKWESISVKAGEF